MGLTKNTTIVSKLIRKNKFSGEPVSSTNLGMFAAHVAGDGCNINGSGQHPVFYGSTPGQPQTVTVYGTPPSVTGTATYNIEYHDGGNVKKVGPVSYSLTATFEFDSWYFWNGSFGTFDYSGRTGTYKFQTGINSNNGDNAEVHWKATWNSYSAYLESPESKTGYSFDGWYYSDR